MKQLAFLALAVVAGNVAYDKFVRGKI